MQDSTTESQGLLLHNLIQYSKSCVFLNVTQFKLLNSDNVAFSYPCEMHTLQAGWVTMVCSVHF